MQKNIALVVTALLTLASHSAFACLGGKQMPQVNDLGRYSEIRVVEVTGVHLTSYEAYQLMQRGAMPWPQPQNDVEYIYPLSSTPGFEVQALVDQTIKGPATSVTHCVLGGCAVVPPKLHDRGIIFIEPGQHYDLAVWQSEGERYRKIAAVLGLNHG
jgi:hypothetical protein